MPESEGVFPFPNNMLISKHLRVQYVLFRGNSIFKGWMPAWNNACRFPAMTYVIIEQAGKNRIAFMHKIGGFD